MNVVNSLLGGSSGGAGASTTTQGLDPQIRQLFLNNYTAAQNSANRLPQQQFANWNGYQNNAADITSNAANNLGYGAVQSGIDTANRVTNSSPYMIGSTGYGAANVNAANAGPAAMADSTGYGAMYGNAAQLNGRDIGNYMNPYIGNVVNSTLTDLNRSRQMALNDNNSAAVKAGAFGGSRQALERAKTQEAYDRNTASTLSNLYNTGFSNAQTAAQNDVNNRQAMTLANLGYGNQASQFGAGAYNTAALQNASQANTQNQYNANLAQNANLANQGAYNTAAQFGANAANTASAGNQTAYQNFLNSQLSAANSLGTLGGQQQNLGLQGANAMFNLGSNLQGLQNDQLNAYRQSILDKQAMLNQALGVNPGGGAGATSSSQTQGKGILSSLFGS